MCRYNSTYAIYIYIYRERERERESWVQVTLDVTLSNITQLNIFQFDVNFDKSTIRLHYLHIFSILAKFQGNQRLITMSSSSFYSLK